MKKLSFICPECHAATVAYETAGKWGTVARVWCKTCGYAETDSPIGGEVNCRCPSCASAQVDIRTVSAQAGNTDWVLFVCRNCGSESGLMDDQLDCSRCEWYDPVKYRWIREINEKLDESARNEPKPGMGTF